MADKVLIVDDDPAVQKMLFKVMKSNGLEAFTASDGAEALELVRKNVYQLILMDINMSGLDGFEAVQTLRKNGCDVPIIIVSGRKEDYDTLYGLDIGADDYITKPFNPVTLGAKAKALIRRSRGPGGDGLLTAGPFQYNTSTLRFFKNGEEIPLSSKENAL
ncbi:MAG: response regulator transcription factor, partial [Oscillospiraceae bacterium]